MQSKADSALLAIPTPADRGEWIKITAAYKAAGGDFETWDEWSQRGDNYDKAGNRATWRSFNTSGGITEATLYGEARAAGWTPPEDGENWKRDKSYRPSDKPRHEAPKPPKNKLDPKTEAEILQYIESSAQNRALAAEYCQRRGITRNTVDRFNLGFDTRERRLVIPYPKAAYYTSRSTRIKPNGDKDPADPKYKNPAGVNKPIFNAPAIAAPGAGFVAITEGQIDAMTLEQYGLAAVAALEPSTVLDAIASAGNVARGKVYLIIPDADTKGENGAAKMREALEAAGLTAYIYPLPPGYHDTNNMAVAAPADLDTWTRSAEGFIMEQKRASLERYKKTINAAARLPKLREYIEASASRPVISTGFKTLDNALGDGRAPGGLGAGLYAIGAISSLGKTTFAMQIADNIAMQGQDVLIIALEMSSFELMGKSISRLTVETADDPRDRKTLLGILAGGRYAKYSATERRTIEEATELYSQFAERLYMLEGMGTITAADIRRAVEKHQKMTGRAPVVLVDYLQILAPADPRATDKTNTDAAVLELKRISRDYDTTVIAISSFNRNNYANRVSMEALKESGAIEYSSDVVIGLQLAGAGTKDFDVDAAKAADPREVEAVILKNRSGKTGQTVNFSYDAKFNLFIDTMNGHTISPELAAEIRADNANSQQEKRRRL